MNAITKMNPVCGIILLESYYLFTIKIESPADAAAINFLLRNELINCNKILTPSTGKEIKIDATDRGRALIRSWMNTPFPVCSWAIPEKP